MAACSDVAPSSCDASTDAPDSINSLTAGTPEISEASRCNAVQPFLLRVSKASCNAPCPCALAVGSQGICIVPTCCAVENRITQEAVRPYVRSSFKERLKYQCISSGLGQMKAAVSTHRNCVRVSSLLQEKSH